MKHLLDMTKADLTEYLAAQGQQAYRAGQILEWVFRKGAGDFEAMTNLPAALRAQLGAELAITTGKVVQRTDTDDGVTKLLIEWPDGERVETVLIPADGRASACLSTQAGCGIGCTFCASGMGGLRRNLTGGEILEQALVLQNLSGQRVTHTVFMGMGEPLANYTATVFAVRALIDSDRMGISARHVTISTVGIPKAIRRLALEDIPVTLAISLHAPNDALRSQIMPAAARASIEDIISAAQDFFRSRKREITLEYVLLAGVNDSTVCAEGLARVAAQLRCNVNLIRYNPVVGLEYRSPSQKAVQAFAAQLTKRGVNVQIRKSRGLEADAACGQLRQRADAAIAQESEPETESQD